MLIGKGLNLGPELRVETESDSQPTWLLFKVLQLCVITSLVWERAYPIAARQPEAEGHRGKLCMESPVQW